MYTRIRRAPTLSANVSWSRWSLTGLGLRKLAPGTLEPPRLHALLPLDRIVQIVEDRDPTSRGRSVADIEAIIQALQAELIRQDRDQVEPVEAEEWLANKGLLKVHPTKAGKNVRDLLRDGLLSGHQAPDRRWVIELTDLQNVVAPQYHFDVERPHTWVVRAGKGGKLAEEFRGRGCIAIGYRPTPDLTGLSAEEVADSVRDAFSDQPEGKIKNFTHQLR